MELADDQDLGGYKLPVLPKLIDGLNRIIGIPDSKLNQGPYEDAPSKDADGQPTTDGNGQPWPQGESALRGRIVKIPEEVHSKIGELAAAIAQHESGNDYSQKSKVKGSSASGLLQWTKATWGGFGGYEHAYQAPPEVQNQRAALDMKQALAKYGNVYQVIANNFRPATAANISKWNEPIKQGNGHVTMGQYVTKVVSNMDDNIQRDWASFKKAHGIK